MIKKIIPTILLLPLLIASCSSNRNSNMEEKYVNIATSGDANVSFDMNNSLFKFETGKSSEIFSINSKKIGITELKNKKTNFNFLNGDLRGFSFVLNNKIVTQNDLGLEYKTFKKSYGIHNEIIITIEFSGNPFDVSFEFTVYPGTSIIASRYILKSTSDSINTIGDLSFIDFVGSTGENKDEQLIYFTGGGDFTGSLEIKKLPINGDFVKEFLSFDHDEEVMNNSGGFFDRTSDVWDGYSGYEPFVSLQNTRSGDGIFFGFEYGAIWKGIYKRENNIDSLNYAMNLFTKSLQKDDVFASPLSFWGTYNTYFDEAANDLLYYQYEYQWDNTSDLYPMLFADTWSSLYTIDFENIIELLKQCRYLGIDLFNIDDKINKRGWYDKKGDWHTEFDIKEISKIAHESGIKTSVWAPVQHYDITSDFIKDNADLMCYDADSSYYGEYMCTGNNRTIEVMKDKIDNIITTNDLNMIKMDGWINHPCTDNNHSHGVDDSDGFAAAYYQYNNYLDYMQHTIDTHEGFSWILCATGGEMDGFEFIRKASYITTTDGGAQNGVYNMSYLFPSGKFQSGYADANKYSPINTRMAGFTGGQYITLNATPSDRNLYNQNLESFRKDFAIYRYLRENGLLGRYSKQYHLSQEIGKAMLMKTNKDATKAVILGIEKGYYKKIYPYGLNDDTEYTVSFYLNDGVYARTGKELKQEGISVAGCPEGEMIFLNILKAPGCGRDTVAPTLTGQVTKENASYYNVNGVALRWDRANDDNFVSYYAIKKNGEIVDKVSKGEFYFDESGLLTDTYEIIAYDGDDNPSLSKEAELL